MFHEDSGLDVGCDELMSIWPGTSKHECVRMKYNVFNVLHDLIAESHIFSKVETCFAGNVLLAEGDQITCHFGGSKYVKQVYLETNCDTGKKASFQISFNDRAKSVV